MYSSSRVDKRNRRPLSEQVCAGAQTLRALRPSTLAGIAPALLIAPPPELCRGSIPRIVLGLSCSRGLRQTPHVVARFLLTAFWYVAL